MRPWIVTATVPSTVFDDYDLTAVLDVLSEVVRMLDGGTTDEVTGRCRPWSVTVEIPAPTAGRAALAGVRVVEVAFGRRALGFDVVTPAEHDVRTARAIDDLRLRPTATGLWSGPCVP